MFVLLPAAVGGSAAHASGGEYTIRSLPAGSYKVQFRPPETANYVGQYYSGKESSEQADLVSAMPGSITEGIDAALVTGGLITGRVTALAGGAPLQGIEVCALFEGCAPTNANGEYTLAGLASGQYTLGFFPPEGSNYVFQYYNGKATEGEADPVNVTAGATTAGINATLAVGGQIAGKVTGAVSKAAVANVRVCIRRAEPAFEFFGCVLTNSGGEYAAVGLPSGEYHVLFSPEEGNYLGQYYNGKANEGEADPVAVEAGKTTSGIDAALASGGEIHGTVTAAATSAPVSGAFVCAKSKGFGYCGIANAAGEYAVQGLPTGEYVVEFSVPPGVNYLTQYYNGKQSPGEADMVSVNVGETKSGIDAALTAAGQITGRVTAAASGAPLVNILVCPVPGFFGRCVVTNTNGEYAIVGLSTGSYKVEFEALEEGGGNWLSQYYNGRATLAESDPVEVTAGSATGGIDAAMVPGAEISGTVTAANGGAPLGEVMVCARAMSGFFRSCATTSAPSPPGKSETPGGGAPSGGGTVNPSGTLASSSFSLLRTPRFNAKTGNLELFLRVADPGSFRWKVAFRNSDVGFADALATAKQGRCKRGFVRHRGRCVHATVPFSSGIASVGAGKVVVKMHATAKALRALRSGHTLHVTGPLTFQSARGGSPVTHTLQAAVHGRAKHGRHR